MRKYASLLVLLLLVSVVLVSFPQLKQKVQFTSALMEALILQRHLFEGLGTSTLSQMTFLVILLRLNEITS